jgi:CheY-like chemotaxis protein
MNTTETSKSHTFRILVVDDSPDAIEFYEPHIEAAWGRLHTIEVERVGSVDDALNRLSVGNYAVLVVSWKNAAFSGGSFLRNLRGYGMRTPTVIVSSLQRGDIRDNVESLGGVFLNKGLLSGIALRDAVASSIRLVNSSQSSSDGVSRRFPFKSKPPRATPPV